MFPTCNTPTLKIEAEFSSGILASLYRNAERHIPEDHAVQLLVSTWQSHGGRHNNHALSTVSLCLDYEEPFRRQERVPHREHSQVTVVANISSV
jgi:hypothetical protein